MSETCIFVFILKITFDCMSDWKELQNIFPYTHTYKFLIVKNIELENTFSSSRSQEQYST